MSPRLPRSLVIALLALAACDEVGPSVRDAGAESDAGLPIVRGRAPMPSTSSHPGTLRLVIWNIKAGTDSSIQRIGQRLAELDGDVVVLQEIDSSTRRSGGVDQPAVLSSLLGADYAFAPAIPWSGGTYGILTLSRHPFTQVRRIALSNALAREPRAALDTEVCVERACLRVVNHHADLVLAASAQSTREILQDLAPRIGSGVGLAGDLNQVATDEGPRACSAASLQDIGARFGEQLTEGGRRIDYAFLDDALARCVRNMSVQTEHDSDHNSLAVDFDLACLPRR